MPMDKCTFNPGNECLGMQKANMLEKSLNSHLDAARQTHKEMYDRIRALETESARRDSMFRFWTSWMKCLPKSHRHSAR